jgi:hypothetical protein
MKELTINDQIKAGSKQGLKRPKTAESIRQPKSGTTFNEDLTKADYSQIYTLNGDKRKK